MTPQELAKEFRRLAAEAKDRSRRHLAREDETAHWIAIGKDQAFAKAAQMLEEKLQPGYELKVEGEGMNATVEYVDEDPLRWLP